LSFRHLLFWQLEIYTFRLGHIYPNGGFLFGSWCRLDYIFYSNGERNNLILEKKNGGLFPVRRF
jgi:hypothetical protein